IGNEPIVVDDFSIGNLDDSSDPRSFDFGEEVRYTVGVAVSYFVISVGHRSAFTERIWADRSDIDGCALRWPGRISLHGGFLPIHVGFGFGQLLLFGIRRNR